MEFFKSSIWSTFIICGSIGVVSYFIAPIIFIRFLNIEAGSSIIFESYGLLLSYSLIVTSISIVILVCIAIKLIENQSFPNYLELKKFKIEKVLLYLGVLLLLWILFNIICILLNESPYSDVFLYVYKTPQNILLFSAVVVIIGPIAEEIFFRGYLLKRLRGHGLSIAISSCLTSGVWLLIHIEGARIIELTSLFFLGILLAYSKEVLNSLYAPIVIHSVNNLAVLLETSLHSKWGFN